MLSLLLAAAAASEPAGLAQSALQPWAMFVGHCWRGPAPVGNAVDTHCFDAVYGGQHVRDRHEVKVDGKTVYAGETLYSVEGQKVSFTYWNSLGGVGRGTAVADGAQLRFTGDMRATPSSKSEPIATTWQKLDGGYRVNDAGIPARQFTRAD